MSLENTNVIDAIGTDKASGSVVLTVIDHWDWSNEQEHLQALQAKLNSYFEFIEGGQIFESYPDAVNRKLCIDVVARYPTASSGQTLLERAAVVASQLSVTITSRVHQGLIS